VELGRTGVAAIGLGMAEASLRETRRFLRGRQSFGEDLSENDALLARLADLRVKVEAARLLAERAASLADRGQRCSTEAAMAKLFASEVACQAAEAAVHLQGGLGFTAEARAEMFYRDCQAFTIGEGTSEIMRLIIGREEFAKDATQA
jgi:alkylation response protein AidB-like acyl-CoA dehydrogenase